MKYKNSYHSPLGKMIMASDGEKLTGLWFDDQKYFALTLDDDTICSDLPVFDETKLWLEEYFKGRKPDFIPPFYLKGTDFQREVWNILLKIPYGSVTTYGDIAKEIAEKRGLSRMSAQAVGGAVGHNPISIIVPCHRVVGTKGSLTGYAGGIDKKAYLLNLENTYLTKNI